MLRIHGDRISLLAALCAHGADPHPGLIPMPSLGSDDEVDEEVLLVARKGGGGTSAREHGSFGRTLSS